MSARMETGLHVDVCGEGPPLVLLHGWAMHGGVFAPLVARGQGPSAARARALRTDRGA